MNRKNLYEALKIPIAIVWMANGLYCKLLNKVPRHQLIVARILGIQHAAVFTKLIGIAEILMALWIVTNIKAKLNAVTQIGVIAIMNIIEFILAPDLLLWGRLNAVYALLFIIFIYCNEFKINPASAENKYA